MPKAYRLVRISIICCLFNVSRALSAPYFFHLTQPVNKDSAKVKSDTAKTDSSAKKPFVLKPIIGLGTGMFSYFGAVQSMRSDLQNPMTSRIGYELMYAQKLSPHTEFNLYALFGQLSVNERTTTLNWNFQSQIEGGGIHFMYKFLPTKDVTPYVLTGLESFEYDTKTDIYDKYGNYYYYWSDGTIRNIAQNAPDAANATIVYRDYSYESDMRSLNIGGSGKYSLQTFAIPVGIGFMFHIGKRTDFLIGSTLHYAFTTHIDGYGDSIHTKKNDMFLMSSVTLRFDLTGKPKGGEEEGGYLPEDLEGPDFLALTNDDYDQDGVRDWDDSCAGTPKGVAVDKKGCPLDSDHDGVPDYRDKQANTPKGAIVDADGVALTDSAMLLQYEMYMDTTGAFARIEVQNTIGKPHGAGVKNIGYTVQLGRYSKGIPPEIMDKLLSIPEVNSTTMPDSSTVYTVGRYTDYAIAQQRQKQLIQDGITDAKVVYKSGKDFIVANGPVGTTVPVDNASKQSKANNSVTIAITTNNASTTSNTSQNNVSNNTSTPSPDMSSVIVYRIQMGAYNHKLSRDVFANIDNLVEVKTENGFFTYSAGSFTNYMDAVNYKTQLMTQGFPDAFIKAYRNGKRVPLDKAGATYTTPSTKEDMSENITHETSTLDKSQISFKVQVGLFKGQPPADIASKYKTMDITKDMDSTGLVHYLVGSYNNYKDAQAMREKIAADPTLKGSFVVAYFKDKQIPLSQAISIMKQ
jgi:hypothetical protein